MTEQTIETQAGPAQTQEQYEFIIDLARKANIRLTRTLTQIRTELTDACAARDALARDNHALRKVRERDTWLADERDEKLVQARDELAAVDEALGSFYCPDSEDRGAHVMRQELEHVRSVAMERKAELSQALNERDEAEKAACASAQDHAKLLERLEKAEKLEKRLTSMEAARDFWCSAYKRHDKRLAILNAALDAAEAALADCGIGGINDKFDGLADAIQQMSAHIKEQQNIIHIHEHALNERDKALQAERRLRREAEALQRDNREAASEYLHSLCFERQLRQKVEQRAERAEALAQLVTLELAALLERLGMAWAVGLEDKIRAHALAAQIREALDDRKA